MHNYFWNIEFFKKLVFETVEKIKKNQRFYNKCDQ